MTRFVPRYQRVCNAAVASFACPSRRSATVVGRRSESHCPVCRQPAPLTGRVVGVHEGAHTTSPRRTGAALTLVPWVDGVGLPRLVVDRVGLAGRSRGGALGDGGVEIDDILCG